MGPSSESGGSSKRIEPLPCHRRIVEHLKANEPAAWKGYASQRRQAQHAQHVRLQLLRSICRSEREALASDAESLPEGPEPEVEVERGEASGPAPAVEPGPSRWSGRC